MEGLFRYTSNVAASIDCVREHFCIVLVRYQDFELQGESKFIFQAAGFVRHSKGKT
jgi:hypothetical protein